MATLHPMARVIALAAGLVAGPLCSPPASAGEVCRFAGTTDDAGQAAITAKIDDEGGLRRVDVVVRFQATYMLLFHVRYLVEEISLWRGSELQKVAVNDRYLVNGHVVHQQWDEFQRAGGEMRGYRIQGKALGEFSRKFPGFVRHWALASFGEPWLRDYHAAPPERRADLDLKEPAMPPDLRSPLALAFYWIRWLPHGGLDAPVFLPGFKRVRLVDLPMRGTSWGAGTLWQARLRYPGLRDDPPSTIAAWVGADRRLDYLALDLHTARWSARGSIHQEGCEGSAIPGGGD